MTVKRGGSMEDMISRKAAINELCRMLRDCFGADDEELDAVTVTLNNMPSAQPTEASCWGCNCPKMERMKEQKTFSEMVHLHDAETHEERTETHACDLISRQAAIDVTWFEPSYTDPLNVLTEVRDKIKVLPSAQPEPQRKKGRWIKKTIKKKIENDYSCSECGRHVSVMRGYDVRMVYPFCHCGADMTEGKE